jgi:hypothetical protein
MTWRRALTIGTMAFALACGDADVPASDTPSSESTAQTGERGESGDGTGEDEDDA